MQKDDNDHGAYDGCSDRMLGNHARNECSADAAPKISFENKNPFNYAMSATPSNHHDSYHQDFQYNVGHSG